MYLKKLTAISLLLGFLFCAVPTLCYGDQNRFAFGARIGYKVFFDNDSEQGEIRNENPQYGGSIFRSINNRLNVGLKFDYWNNPFDTYFGAQANVYSSITFHKFSVAYQYKAVRFSSNNLNLILGNSLDLYFASIVYNNPSSTTHKEHKVAYNNFGIGIDAEFRYKFVSLWSELSIIRFAGGETKEANSIWDQYGVPNINFHNLTAGIGLFLTLQ